jgi:hypothetical protein
MPNSYLMSPPSSPPLPPTPPPYYAREGSRYPLLNEIQEAALFLFINSEFSTEVEGKERQKGHDVIGEGEKSNTTYPPPPSSARIAASSES